MAGYIVAALIVIRDMQAAGVAYQWQDYILPVAICLFGRLAADDLIPHKPVAKPTIRRRSKAKTHG